MSIELSGVDRLYRNDRGILAIDVSCEEGVTGFLGPNGAGKTTLFEVIATAARPQSGSVRYWGRAQSAFALSELRERIGFLPQDPLLPPGFRVDEYLRYAAALQRIGPRRARRDETNRVLDVVALRDRADERIGALSGGMRQRVALARALLGSPRLLVLDEPTVGLDPGQRAVFRDALLTMAESATVLVSSHQTDDLSALSSRLVVLVEGRVRFTGTTEEFAATAQGNVWVSDERAPATARVTIRTPDGRFRHIGEPPDGATLTPATIEDAYLALTDQLQPVEFATDAPSRRQAGP